MKKEKNFRESVKEPNSHDTNLEEELDPEDDLTEGGIYGYLDWFYDGEIPGEEE